MSRIRLRRWLYAACILCLILAGLGLAARWAWREYAPLLAREQIEAALSRALERVVRVGG
ncbi:MAG TPA: hypothetical protein VLT62_04480 [Candidatus Methylomirabilis sp.]|nr:hypothetical protein [Candidatus Methylomirabilis sp.]